MTLLLPFKCQTSHKISKKNLNSRFFLNVCVFAFLGPKMSPSLKLHPLYPFFNTCHQEQFQKNLKNRLRKNSKFDLFINLLNLLIFLGGRGGRGGAKIDLIIQF